MSPSRKPKTKRAKRFLERREPKLTENTKNAMLIKGGNANLTVTEVLKDIVSGRQGAGGDQQHPCRTALTYLRSAFCYIALISALSYFL